MKPGEIPRELRRRNPDGLRRRRARRGAARGDRRGDRAGPGAGASRASNTARCAPGSPAHFREVLDQPIPERLEAAARAGARADTPVAATCCSFPRAARARRAAPWRAREWIAMAASLCSACCFPGGCSCRETQGSSRRARARWWRAASSPARSTASSRANSAVKSQC